jgi:hypothetical protein
VALVSDSIPNLINGVSQQPYSLRNPSQCEQMENCYPSVVEGLKKRPPTRHVANVFSGTLAESFIHTINRDQTEQYLVVITDGNLQVFDLEGNEKTVTFPTGKGYLASANPASSFRAVTVADYTFIVNTETTVEMANTTSTQRDPEALVFVKQAAYETDYRLTVGGTAASYTTGASGTLSTRTIADQLRSGLVGGGWTVGRYGSVLYIRDASNFTIAGEDGQGNRYMQTIKSKVQRFDELPVVGRNNFNVQVVGDRSSNFDDYYVEFTTNDGSLGGEGTWRETIAQGIPFRLDYNTMPHQLVRNADGTFTFNQAVWGDRKVGDEISAPNPSFVGRKISDVFFFKNRLGFLSDSNVILSKAGKFFDFFPSTVTTILDGDPIDVAASTNQVAILRHAIPFNEQLLLFSDLTQFVLQGGDLLTPKTVSIDLATQFESSLRAKPVGAGRNVFFAVDKGNYSGVREYFVDVNNDTNDAADVTSHVPKYVRGDLIKMCAATNEDILVALADQDKTVLYPYKYYWANNEKLQSAWSRWSFNGATVLNVDFIETSLFLVLQRGSEVTLERMEVNPGYLDPGASYLTHLDRKVSEADCSAVAFDPVTNRTTWTLPYTTDAGAAYQVVTREDGGTTVPGIVLQDVAATGNTVSVRGDHRTDSVFIGETYGMEFEFSRQVVRESTPGGGSNVVASGRLQLLNWTLVFNETGFFNATVHHTHRPDGSVYPFTGRITGATTNQIGRVSLSTGRFKFPVLGENTQTRVRITSDSFLPAAFQSAEWQGRFVLRGTRL